MTALVVSNALLWLLVIGLAVVVLALVRQLGVLHERISPVGALMLAKGLKVGELAPALLLVADELHRLARRAPAGERGVILRL